MAGMRIGHRPAITLCLLAWVGIVSAQAPSSTPDPEVRRRVDAFFEALASGQPATFEAMARDHCTPAFIERRTPADRAQMLQRLRGDFGSMRLEAVRRTDDGVELTIHGSTGVQGRLLLTLEPQPPGRIDRFGIEVEAGGGRELPAVPLPPITRDTTDAALAPALDGYLSSLAANGQFSGVVLVSRAGRTAFARAYGEADRDTHVANALTTRFNIGSINKSFTAVAIARLVGEGTLKLTDTVGLLLPDHPGADARAATVQQLLDHQGGIADFFGPAFEAAPKDALRSNRDYYRLVASQPLTFAPGTSRRYCNGCYIVLGEIIAQVSGRPYEDYIAEHVFRPAGMKGAGFLGQEPPQADVAQGYTRRSAAGTDLRRNAQMVGARGNAAGGAYATAGDLLAYVEALRAHRLLTPAQTASVMGGGGLGIAGGAPGLNAVIEANGDLVVIVLANLDPPTAEQLGTAIARQLTEGALR
jgi:CubicO group peptidase (beta-lactamase class C family)